MLNFFGSGRVNFGAKYLQLELGFCSAYTHSKGKHTKQSPGSAKRSESSKKKLWEKWGNLHAIKIENLNEKKKLFFRMQFDRVRATRFWENFENLATLQRLEFLLKFPAKTEKN